MLKDIVNGHWTQRIRIKNHNPGGLHVYRYNRNNNNDTICNDSNVLLIYDAIIYIT